MDLDKKAKAAKSQIQLVFDSSWQRASFDMYFAEQFELDNNYIVCKENGKVLDVSGEDAFEGCKVIAYTRKPNILFINTQNQHWQFAIEVVSEEEMDLIEETTIIEEEEIVEEEITIEETVTVYE